MAQTQVETKRMTLEEVKQLNPDEQPGELVRGVFVPMSRPTIKHGFISAKVVFLLVRYLEQNPIGQVICNDAGFVLEQQLGTLRGPDVSVILNERIPPEGLPDDWWEGAPDLAVEIVSRTQNAHELARKALDYLQAGTKMVWVVDPESRTVAVYTPPNQIRILCENEDLDGGDVLPGFRIKVGDLFK
jgi:Uma2 family endonuclease